MPTEGPGPYEIRVATLDRGPELDEVIARNPGMVHFEHLGENGLWCGITLSDGRSLAVNIWAKRGKLGWRVSEDWPGGKEYV